MDYMAYILFMGFLYVGVIKVTCAQLNLSEEDLLITQNIINSDFFQSDNCNDLCENHVIRIINQEISNVINDERFLELVEKRIEKNYTNNDLKFEEFIRTFIICLNSKITGKRNILFSYLVREWLHNGIYEDKTKNPAYIILHENTHQVNSDCITMFHTIHNFILKRSQILSYYYIFRFNGLNFDNAMKVITCAHILSLNNYFPFVNPNFNSNLNYILNKKSILIDHTTNMFFEIMWNMLSVTFLESKKEASAFIYFDIAFFFKGNYEISNDDDKYLHMELIYAPKLNTTFYANKFPKFRRDIEIFALCNDQWEAQNIVFIDKFMEVMNVYKKKLETMYYPKQIKFIALFNERNIKKALEWIMCYFVNSDPIGISIKQSDVFVSISKKNIETILHKLSELSFEIIHEN